MIYSCSLRTRLFALLKSFSAGSLRTQILSDELLIKIKAEASSRGVFGLRANREAICVKANRPTILDSGLLRLQ